METDAEFQIMWPTSSPNTNVNNTCRGGTGAYMHVKLCVLY